MAAQWEVVGKSSSKKTKVPPKALSKAEKKAFAERIQRKEAYGKPRSQVTEAPNTYGALSEDDPKDSAAANRGDFHQSVGNGAGVNGSVGQQKKPAKPKKPTEKKPTYTLEQALSHIDAKDLETLLLKVQTTFPDSPLLWLKDLASFLNLKLDTVPETDPLFEKQPSDYPLCKVQKSLLKMLRKVIDATNFGVLELFFEHCINSMITDMGKGISTYGYRIFIQILAHDNPKIIQANLSRYLELIKTNQNRQLRCLSIMWAVGQPGVKSLSCGLRIWIDIMFPLLATRTLSMYAVTYLENIFSWHTDLRAAYGAITFRDFFPIFDVVFSGTATLPSQLQKRLLAVYPKIKSIAFTNKPDNTLRNFFPSFLARTSPHASEPMRSEITNCLITCLSQDKHCFSLWRQMYTKHFTQSGFLLQRLADDYNRKAVQVDKKILIDTVKTFNVTNEDLAAQKKTNFDGYDQCNAACKALLLESSRFHFPWFLFFMTTLSALIALILYDVYVNKGKFQGCKTHVFLEQSGILAFSMQVYTRVREYSILAYKWSEVNLPVYYAKTVKVVGPYLVLFWQKCVELKDYLLVISTPLRNWIYTKSLDFYAWLVVNGPVWYAEFVRVMTPVWTVCHHYLSIVWGYVVTYSSLFWVWLQENVLVGRFSVENLQKLSVETLLILREYLNQFILWCSNLLSSN